jgi:hypothetical protein
MLRAARNAALKAIAGCEVAGVAGLSFRVVESSARPGKLAALRLTYVTPLGDDPSRIIPSSATPAAGGLYGAPICHKTMAGR